MARRAVDKRVRITPAMLVERHGLIELAGLDQLAGNPHTADRVALRRSVDEFGQFEPIVIWRGQILIGNNRAEVFAEAGETSVAGYDLSDLDLSEARRWAMALASNRIAALGSDDPALLAAALVTVDGGLIGATGYDLGNLPRGVDEAYAALTIDGLKPGVDVDEFDAEPPTVPVSKLGDLWELGPHRLYVGDGASAGAWSSVLRGDRPRLMVTDPPYGVDYRGGSRAEVEGTTRASIVNDALSAEDTQSLWVGAWRLALEHLVPGGSFYSCGPPGRDLVRFLTSFDTAGMPYRHVLIWVKDSHVLGRSDYHYQHEPIVVGDVPDDDVDRVRDFVPVAYGWTVGAAHEWRGGRDKSTVWDIARPYSSADHPTMKPVELYARAMRHASKPSDVVVDPFAGSGTLLAAALLEHRSARMIELSPGYADVIVRRFQTLTGATGLRNGKPRKVR